ncbi:peptidoglycan bridge formation glycyltransferase FemA/FemB family protein [bacterium]|nr:peptidoglycan bridge formation glycyltransferase FemA/FemB family protein [bacterium]
MTLNSEEKNYDEFLKTRFISGSFLQSSIWRDFLKAQKLNTWQAAIIENNQTIAVCLFYENKLPLDRSYLYAPKGPIIDNGLSDQKKQEALALILSKVRDVTKETRQREEIFLTTELEDIMFLLPEFKKSPDVQPRDTWILDLDKDTKDILEEMHTKTRYNIALAKRRGVKIKFSNQAEDLKYFLKLISKTACRNQISVHSDNYYALLWQNLVKHGAGQLALAELDGKIITANIIIKFGSAVTYLHGASDYNYRKHMAPHLLQWETIKQAKEQGFKIYDFWGIAPEDDSKPSWRGFSRFKRSFGGRPIKAAGAYDLIYNKTWYSIYKLSKKILKR